MTPREAVLEAAENGKKGVELVTDVVMKLGEEGLLEAEASLDLPIILQKMVEEGELVEIEYVLPGTDRIKSFYLPKGTEVRVLNAETL